MFLNVWISVSMKLVPEYMDQRGDETCLWISGSAWGWAMFLNIWFSVGMSYVPKCLDQREDEICSWMSGSAWGWNIFLNVWISVRMKYVPKCLDQREDEICSNYWEETRPKYSYRGYFSRQAIYKIESNYWTVILRYSSWKILNPTNPETWDKKNNFLLSFNFTKIPTKLFPKSPHKIYS